MIIFGAASFLFAVWIRFCLSYALLLRIRKRGPVVFIAMVFLITFGTMIFWIPAILMIVAPVQLDFLDALVVTLGIGLVTSLAILVKGIYSWTHTCIDISSYYPDLHTKVCMMIDSTPENILPGYNNPEVNISVQEDFKLTDTHQTTVTMELGLSILIVSTIFLTIVWLIEVITPAYHDALSVWILYPATGMMMIPLWLASVVIRYRRWKEFWMTYWIHIRNMTLPEERILDLVPNPPTPFQFIQSHDSVDPHLKQASNLAKDIDLNMGPSPSHLAVLWVHWFLRTEKKMKEITSEKIQGMKDFEEAYNKLEKKTVSRTFDEGIFPDLIKQSLILDSFWIAESWPQVARGISELKNWALENKTERMNLFEMATKEMEILRTAPSVPIPHSIAWLLGFIVLLISIVPYAISLISALISQAG